MKDIKQFQNKTLNKGKLSEIIKESDRESIKSLLGVKDSQLSNIRCGTRRPSIDGLLRLMMYHGLSANDLSTEKPAV